MRVGHSLEVADMIDAAALLWRIELQGDDIGARWAELASAWVQHIADGFRSFDDLHAMLAFVGACEWDLAHRFERELAQR